MFELTNCEVPADNLLGSEGDGFRIAMGTLVSGRLSVAAGCLGVIEDCLAEAITYAKERQQHGKAIARHQLVQEHIAAIEMHRVATEALVMQAAAGQGRQRRDAERRRPARDRPTCWRPRPSCSPPTPPGTPPTGRCRFSAAAAGPRCTGRAGT